MHESGRWDKCKWDKWEVEFTDSANDALNGSLNSVSDSINNELGSIKLELDQLKDIVFNNYVSKARQAGGNIRLVTPGLRRVGI